MKLTKETLETMIEEVGFSVLWWEDNAEKVRCEIGQYTPLGEDWSFGIDFDGTHNGFVGALIDYAYDFDIDNEVEPLVRMRGTYGVPDSISDLVEDAKWKKYIVCDLIDYLNKVGGK